MSEPMTDEEIEVDDGAVNGQKCSLCPHPAIAGVEGFAWCEDHVDDAGFKVGALVLAFGEVTVTHYRGEGK